MLLRIACFFLIVLLYCVFSAAGAGEGLTDAELAQLLALVKQQSESAADFVVLPEDYQNPEEAASFLVVPESSEGAGFRLLLIGVDTDNSALTGRSDTMVLAQLDPGNGRVRLVSFMRDLYVEIPGRGHNRLNAAYAYGGSDLLIRTLENSFGVRADGYLAVNFSLMSELVDAIGGIEIEVTDRELDSLNAILDYANRQQRRPRDSDKLAPGAGLRSLSGPQTLAYARIRKMDSDYQRVIRQQQVLGAILKRMLALDFASLSQVLTRFIPEVKTDLSIAQALSLLGDLLLLSSAQVEGLRVPVGGSAKSRIIRGAYYIVPNLSTNRQAIQDFLGS